MDWTSHSLLLLQFIIKETKKKVKEEKEAGYRQTPDHAISQLMFKEGCTTLEQKSFNQTILWNCPNGTRIATP
jgi:hypothetical protein